MLTARDISLTFAKGLAVLKAFDERQPQMSIADIARVTDLDPATARRLVLTLVHEGYVRKENRAFSLTPRILILASGFLRGNQFGKVIQPVLNDCAVDARMAVSLWMADGDSAILVAQSTLHSTSITYGFTIGSRLPLLHTATGRMLLAHGPADWAAESLERSAIERRTPRSLDDRDAVAAEVRKAAADGFALVSDEFELDVTGIAVPVGSQGETKAVLGVSDLTTTFRDARRVEEVVSNLRRSAIELRRTKLF